VISNSAAWGGGSSGSTLNNCTVTGNSAGTGGGAVLGTLNNCIVFYNSAADYGPNYFENSDLPIEVNYTCTTPMPTNGVANLTNAPKFVDLAGGNLRLQSNSPCINAGNNDYVTTSVDLDGNPRISAGVVDVVPLNPLSRGRWISHS
jgi:predicted outer membrane repeat protein